LLWPVIAVGVVQMLVIQVVATTIQARTAHDGSRPLNAMTLSSAGADASTGTAETWDRTTPVLSGSH